MREVDPVSALDRVVIDHDSDTAPFEQVRLQIIASVRAGRLLAGQKLPTVRALAADAGIAANTAARAYRALEAEGVIETRGRKGTFVAASGDPGRQRAERAAVDYVSDARGLGFGDDEIRAMIESALG